MSFLYDGASFRVVHGFELQVYLGDFIGHTIGVKKIRLFSSALRFEWRLLIQFKATLSKPEVATWRMWKSTFRGSNLIGS